MLSQDEINKLLDAAKPRVIESLQEEISKTISYNVLAQARETISKHVADWVVANVVPDITKQLIESRDGLISVGAKVAEQLADELVKGMTEQISENLKHSWTRREILEKLFKG